MSKLTVTLPDDLHAQIRQELEEQGITTGQFIEMVVTEYFTKSKEGENNMATRTIAWQDVLAVFASQTAGDANGAAVAYLDADNVDRLRTVLWDMNWTGVPKHKPVRWSKPMRRANRKP